MSGKSINVDNINLPTTIQWQTRGMLSMASSTRYALFVKGQGELFMPTVKKEVNGKFVTVTDKDEAAKLITPDKHGKKTDATLTGAYPFMFDVIGYVLTHKDIRDYAYEQGKGITDKITLPEDILENMAIDNTGGYVRDFYRREIYELQNQEKPYKTVLIDNDNVIRGIPLIVQSKMSYGEPIPHIKRRRRIRTNIVEITFWKELVSFATGRIQRPKAFYAHLIEAAVAIEKDARQREIDVTIAEAKAKGFSNCFLDRKNLRILALPEGIDVPANVPINTKFIDDVRIGLPQELEQYIPDGCKCLMFSCNISKTDFGNISNINRLWSYIYLHDNGTAESRHFDFVEFMPHFRTEYVRVDRGNVRIRDIKKAIADTDKALKVIEAAFKDFPTGRNIIGHKLGNGIAGGLTVYFDRTNGGKEYAKDITAS